MTSEEKVKQLWPGARLVRGVYQWQLFITKGRIIHGDTAAEAWANAWDSITQDDEICNGDPSITGTETAIKFPKGA